MHLKDWLLATRPWSFTMSFVSVSVGAVFASLDGPFDFVLYLLTLLGMILLHAATNLINDYYDYKSGVDKPQAPTALYRPHPLVMGIITPRQVFTASILLYLIAVAIGLYLVYMRGLVLLLIGLIGVLASFFYTAGPIKYKYYALGELSVALMWGPLIVSGSYFVQLQKLSWQAVLISIPLGILVALVLLANNLRDIQYDSQVGIKTLGTLLGEKKTLILYYALAALAYAAVILLIAFKLLSPWGLLVFLSVLLAWRLAHAMSLEIPKDADAKTAQLDTLFGLLLIASLILEKLLPLSSS